MARPIYSDTSDPNFSAITAWVTAGLLAAGAGWVAWMLGWPLVFDFDDPDFNPIILLLGILVAAAAWSGWKALLWTLRHRRFGATSMEIAGPVPVPMGGVLEGRIRAARPLAPDRDYRIKLTCYDMHMTRDIRTTHAGPDRPEEFPVWSEEITLPPTTDAEAGLPFRFELPGSVGPKPQSQLEGHAANPYFRFKASINLPGFRRIHARNSPPVSRRWGLTIEAPTPGASFLAAFIVPVREE